MKMWQDLNNKNNKENVDKNLKLMSISAIVLVVLFVYTILKSDSAIQGGSYYIGLVFLLILMFLAFGLQKYKNKIKDYIPKNKFTEESRAFQEELEKSQEKQTSTITVQNKTSSVIEAVNSNITFKDIAGITEVKAELEEVVDFLNNPKKYHKYDVSLPKGVLLVGPPGVGKTLIAKAVAGEADVPFFYQSGASFVHIYVGMGAKRVRELFNAAKAKAPSIIFIDEIDAVGKSRGGSSNDEREATLNELLTQMDGFDATSGVMVIAATNKIEVLDEALLRAGRFDRRVILTLPSKEDRVKILELYLKNKKYNFDIEKLARDTSGFSSAAIATLINEALLNMIKREGTSIVEQDLETAKNKIRFGTKQPHFLSDEEKDILATYQATKAYATRTNIALHDEGIKQTDIKYPSKTELQRQIFGLLAGSVGVSKILGDEYVVFESEIKEAYKIADDLVNRYHLATSQESIINSTKALLEEMVDNYKNEILEVKQTLLKDEVVVF
jgi:ATP-dependent metalloprotease FtsH